MGTVVVVRRTFDDLGSDRSRKKTHRERAADRVLSPTTISPRAASRACSPTDGMLVETRGLTVDDSTSLRAPTRTCVVVALRARHHRARPADAPHAPQPAATRIVAVMPEDSRRGVRRALEAGADGVVFETELESTLSLTVRAVLAGQTVVPAAGRLELDRPTLSTREKQVPAHGRRRDEQQGDRRRAVPRREHRQVPPLVGVLEARRALAQRGRRPDPPLRRRPGGVLAGAAARRSRGSRHEAPADRRRPLDGRCTPSAWPCARPPASRSSAFVDGRSRASATRSLEHHPDVVLVDDLHDGASRPRSTRLRDCAHDHAPAPSCCC